MRRRGLFDTNGMAGTLLRQNKTGEAMHNKDARNALALIQQVGHELRTDPAWYREFEDLDPFTAPREVVEQLRRSAPTPFAKGYRAGIMVMRQQLHFGPTNNVGMFSAGWMSTSRCAVIGLPAELQQLAAPLSDG